MQPQVVPPGASLFRFFHRCRCNSELYCDGGNVSMLQKLDGVKNRNVRRLLWVSLRLPSISRMKNHFYRSMDGLMREINTTLSTFGQSNGASPSLILVNHSTRDLRCCIPILPETAHPRSREPLELSGVLPWDNCYHPPVTTFVHVYEPNGRDYSQSPCVMLSAPLVKAIPEDIRYGQLLRAGIDDDEALRILDGRQDTPEMDLPDDISERYLAPIILKKTRHLCPLCVSTMSCQTSQRYLISAAMRRFGSFPRVSKDLSMPRSFV